VSADWTRLLAAWGLEPHEPRLQQFREDLIRFNRGRNLVSRAANRDDVAELILEAAAAARALALQPGLRLLDLGSGGGLPGIPVAIVCPEVRVDLLERRSTRCDFLRRECRVLQVTNATVLEGDALRLGGGPPHAGAYAVVLLKAVAQPAAALTLAAPFLRRGGVAVIFARAASTAGAAGADNPEASQRQVPAGWTLERRVPLELIAGDRPAGLLLVLRPDALPRPASDESRGAGTDR
jgi:16S rRNA (guanine527-N7)-methyltransferase